MIATLGVALIVAGAASAAQRKNVAMSRQANAVTAAVGPPVTVRLVLKNALVFGPDEITVAPTSDTTSFTAGAIFYLEVWAQTTHPTGLASVSLDITFDPAQVIGTGLTDFFFNGGIFHGLSLFNSLTNGTVDNATGLVDDLSGSYLPTSGCTLDSTGVAPVWSRVAVLEMQAVVSTCPTFVATTANSAVFGTGLCGVVGDVPDIDITYEGIGLPAGVAPQINVNMEIDALDAAAVPTRLVNFVITDCAGPVADVRNLPITFSNKSATVALVGFPDCPSLPQWLSVQEGHTLRRLAPLVFDPVTFIATVDMTVASGNQLVSADWQTATVPQDNLVDGTDFSILASAWNQPILANLSTGADSTGNGVQDTADFTAVQVNAFKTGDAVDGCAVGATRQAPPNPGGRPVAAAGDALVDLALGPQPRAVTEGVTFDLGLFAISARADGQDQTVAAMDVVLRWDPLLVELVGTVGGGPYHWNASTFFDDSGLDGLNNTFADGDAKYTALAIAGTPAFATTDGLWVTTFRFRALQTGLLADVVIEPSLGIHSETRVFGADTPNQRVTGLLRSAGVTVVPLEECDGDGDIDLAEFSHLQSCFTGARPMTNTAAAPAYSQAVADCCRPFDYDADGDIDQADLAFFVKVAASPR